MVRPISQAFDARRAQLAESGSASTSVYPYLEVYFVDKLVFSFPHVGEESAKDAASAPLFTHPDDLKKIK